jgi:aryl-alcohol dehydrogenase-like predicted oxidoreductase
MKINCEVGMKQRRVGKNGPKVGEIGLGAMSFAGPHGPTDEPTSHRTLDKALELGCNHIDTALIYGPHTSELFIGSWLRKNPSARKKLHIATKGGIQPDPREFINTATFLRECIEGSLKRLGVDCIDLYYVHRRDLRVPIEDVTEILAKFVKEGKARAIGYSEISPGSLERAAKVHHIAAVQNEYSLITRLPELGLIQTCERLGTALVAFSPLARGALVTHEFDPQNMPEKDWRRGIPRFVAENWLHNKPKLAAFRKFAKKRKVTVEALSLAWILARSPCIIPIPGTRSAEHLAVNAAASDIRLTKKDLAEIDKLLPPGWAHGNRYNDQQQVGAELYC